MSMQWTVVDIIKKKNIPILLTNTNNTLLVKSKINLAYQYLHIRQMETTREDKLYSAKSLD